MTEQKLQIKETDWGFIVEPEPGFVLNDNNIFSVIGMVVDKAKETGKKRILFDETNIIRKVSFLKLMDAIEHFQKTADHASVYKQAFILPHPADSSNLKFVENAGFNRGVMIQYFSDRETAVEWLLK
jgi:hypothetical protein